MTDENGHILFTLGIPDDIETIPAGAVDLQSPDQKRRAVKLVFRELCRERSLAKFAASAGGATLPSQGGLTGGSERFNLPTPTKTLDFDDPASKSCYSPSLLTKINQYIPIIKEPVLKLNQLTVGDMLAKLDKGARILITFCVRMIGPKLAPTIKQILRQVVIWLMKRVTILKGHALKLTHSLSNRIGQHLIAMTSTA